MDYHPFSGRETVELIRHAASSASWLALVGRGFVACQIPLSPFELHFCPGSALPNRNFVLSSLVVLGLQDYYINDLATALEYYPYL